MRLLLILFVVLSASGLAYENQEAGVRFQEPQGWEARSGPKEVGAAVRFYAPEAPGPRGSLGFSFRELGDVETLTRAEVLSVARQLAAELEDYKMLGTKTVEVAGVPAHLVSFRARRDTFELRTTQVFLVRSGALYVFTLITDPDDHDAQRQRLDHVLASLQWLD